MAQLVKADCPHEVRIISNSKEEKLFDIENISIIDLNIEKIMDLLTEKESVLTKEALVIALSKAEKTKEFLSFNTKDFEAFVEKTNQINRKNK